MIPQVPPPGRPQRTRPDVPAPAQPAAQPTQPAHLRPVPGHMPPAVATTAVVPTPAKPKRPALTTLTKAQRSVTPAEEVAFATVEREMGGRQKFVSTLASAQLPADITRVLGAIADPENDRLSLARICAAQDVSLAKLLDIFQSALMARGRLQARVTIATRLPDVAAAVMDDAVGGTRTCTTCLGAGRVDAPTPDDPSASKPCESCRGKGTVVFTPDHETQKTALKIGGLLESGRGVSVNVNQQTFAMGGAADSGSYDKLIASLDGHLYGRGRARLQPAEDAAVDGEVVDGDQDGPVA